MRALPFADLVHDEALLARITLKFEEVIAESFIRRPHFLQMTRASAVRDRFRMLEDALRMMRGDLKWSWARASDHLLLALLTHLDGGDWSASIQLANGQAMWSPPTETAT